MSLLKQVLSFGMVLSFSPVLLGQQAIRAPETHVYKKVGDCAIRADVYRSQQTGTRPAILFNTRGR